MRNEPGAVKQRLAKLERQNRRMKLSAIASLVIVGAVMLTGQTSRQSTPSELRARSFILVDAQGRQRAILDLKKDEPGLALLDENGNVRALLSLVPEGPILDLIGTDGKSAARVDSLLNQPGLVLLDANRNVRAGLTMNPLGPGLDIADASGGLRASLEAGSNGPALALFDANGYETQVGVTDLITPMTGETHKTSAASIVLFGKDKKVLWSAPPQE